MDKISSALVASFRKYRGSKLTTLGFSAHDPYNILDDRLDCDYWTSRRHVQYIRRCFAFFFLFFSAATIPKLSPDGYARNLARIRLPVQGSLCFWNFLKKSKNQVTTSEKHRKIGNFFDPRLTFSLAVEKRLKLFEKSFRRSKPG